MRVVVKSYPILLSGLLFLSIVNAASLAYAQDEEALPGGYTLEDVPEGADDAALRAKEVELMRKLSAGDNTDGQADTKNLRAGVHGLPNDESEEIDFVDAGSAGNASREVSGVVKAAHSDDENAAIRAERAAAQNELSAEIKKQKGLVSDLKSTNNSLKQKLTAAEQKAQSMEKQLAEAQNRLLLAETEVDRLSRLIDTRKGKLGPQFSRAAVVQQPAAANAKVQTAAAVADDVLVGTIVVDKANLRVQPGKDNSVVMTVPRNTTLVIEMRQGEWYRVITPLGSRAWVHGDMLAFGGKSDSSPTRTLKIRGVETESEDNALRLISGNAKQVQ